MEKKNRKLLWKIVEEYIMSHYPKPDSQIRDKVKVVLDLSYATKKELDHLKGTDKSDWAAKKDFFCFESSIWQTRH